MRSSLCCLRRNQSRIEQKLRYRQRCFIKVNRIRQVKKFLHSSHAHIAQPLFLFHIVGGFGRKQSIRQTNHKDDFELSSFRFVHRQNMHVRLFVFFAGHGLFCDVSLHKLANCLKFPSIFFQLSQLAHRFVINTRRYFHRVIVLIQPLGSAQKRDILRRRQVFLMHRSYYSHQLCKVLARLIVYCFGVNFHRFQIRQVIRFCKAGDG